MYALIDVVSQAVASSTSPQLPLWASIMLGMGTAGVITALINFWPNLKRTNADTKKAEQEGEKVDAEAADIIQKAAGELVKQIQDAAHAAAERYEAQNRVLLEQNTDLATQLEELKIEIASLREGLDLLSQQLRENGINPVYPPMPPAV